MNKQIQTLVMRMKFQHNEIKLIFYSSYRKKKGVIKHIKY